MRWLLGVLLALLVASCGGGGGDDSKDAIPLPPTEGGANIPAPPPAGVAARAGLLVGIGDQRPDTFADPEWKALRLKTSRLIVPWNGIFTNKGQLERWLNAARAAGVEPLVAFNHTSGDRCPAKPCRAPSVAQYRTAFRVFRKAFPWVRTFAPWNEANHQSQPTGKNPRRAAEYYNVLRAGCRGCKIVGADLLDSSNMKRWLGVFNKYVKTPPSLWGLHNYSDTNRFRTKGTKALLALVKGEVWLTETGGVVTFTTSGGKVALAYNESRAARSIDFVFRLAALDKKRIKRVYLYQWRKTNSFDRFDAGIVRPNGRPRPSLNVLRRRLGLAPLPGVSARMASEASAEASASTAITPSDTSTTPTP